MNIKFFVCAALLMITAGFAPGPESAGSRGVRPQSSGGDDAAQGALLIGKSGCTNCHGPSEDHPPILPWAAPGLEYVGSRRAPGYLQEFLLNPALAKPQTRMPFVLSSVEEPQRPQAAADLAEYIRGLGGPFSHEPAPFDQHEPVAGSKLYQTTGCAACHGDASAFEYLQKATNLPSLPAYLLDPKAYHPSGRMPSMALTAAEARSIATYLLTIQSGGPETSERSNIQHSKSPGLRYLLYEGTWDRLPNFKELTPKHDGVVDSIRLPEGIPDDHFGLVFLGETRLEEGTYHFELQSDDGSRLSIDDRVIIDNDATHAPLRKKGTANLEGGVHQFRIEFFERDGGEELEFTMKHVSVAGSVSMKPDFLYETRVIVPEQLSQTRVKGSSERGKQLYQMLACERCHPGPDATIVPAAAPPLDKLKFDGTDCLTGAGAPVRYALTDGEQSQIKAAIQSRRPAPGPAADRLLLASTLQSYQCTACHRHADAGGPGDYSLALFTTNGEAELGDEGRIPPPLTGVGRKLKKEWVREVLENNGRVRPYMATRMPQFKTADIHSLPDLFERVDPPGDHTAPAFDLQRIEAGRDMTGTGAFSCISCHKLAGNDSLGVPAMDLATTTRRLHYNWFRDYLLDPGALRPGTRMPQFWPGGVSTLDRVLAGDTTKQIESLWAYYSLGSSMPVPRGLKRSDLEIRPEGPPVIFRTFFKDVGPRGICIGFQENIHCVYNADNGAIAKIWRGRFINASPVWVARAGQNVVPMSPDVITLPGGPSVAKLDQPEAPWPQSHPPTFRFIAYGHRVPKNGSAPVDREVYVEYQLDNIKMTESVAAQLRPTGAALTRSIHFGKGGAGLRARVAQGSLEAHNGGFLCIQPDGKKLSVRISEGFASVREIAGVKELLVAPAVADGEGRIQIQYTW